MKHELLSPRSDKIFIAGDLSSPWSTTPSSSDEAIAGYFLSTLSSTPPQISSRNHHKKLLCLIFNVNQQSHALGFSRCTPKFKLLSSTSLLVRSNDPGAATTRDLILPSTLFPRSRDPMTHTIHILITRDFLFPIVHKTLINKIFISTSPHPPRPHHNIDESRSYLMITIWSTSPSLLHDLRVIRPLFQIHIDVISGSSSTSDLLFDPARADHPLPPLPWWSETQLATTNSHIINIRASRTNSPTRGVKQDLFTSWSLPSCREENNNSTASQTKEIIKRGQVEIWCPCNQ